MPVEQLRGSRAVSLSTIDAAALAASEVHRNVDELRAVLGPDPGVQVAVGHEPSLRIGRDVESPKLEDVLERPRDTGSDLGAIGGNHRASKKLARLARRRDDLARPID